MVMLLKFSNINTRKCTPREQYYTAWMKVWRQQHGDNWQVYIVLNGRQAAST